MERNSDDTDDYAIEIPNHSVSQNRLGLRNGIGESQVMMWRKVWLGDSENSCFSFENTAIVLLILIFFLV
jgi:hypothetical protein